MTKRLKYDGDLSSFANALCASDQSIQKAEYNWLIFIKNTQVANTISGELHCSLGDHSVSKDYQTVFVMRTYSWN